jgi:hypothetical protein
MALTEQQKVRVKIQDAPIAENLTRYGDGTAVSFLLPHANVFNAGAYVPVGATAWSATGAAFDPSGVVVFSNVISANSAYNVRYQHTTFSDDEIQNFLDAGGSVVGAALEATEALMFDAVKRARWMASDGTSYDDTSAQNHLREMHAILSTQVEAESSSAGGFGSWSLNQGDW